MTDTETIPLDGLGRITYYRKETMRAFDRAKGCLAVLLGALPTEPDTEDEQRRCEVLFTDVDTALNRFKRTLSRDQEVRVAIDEELKAVGRDYFATRAATIRRIRSITGLGLLEAKNLFEAEVHRREGLEAVLRPAEEYHLIQVLVCGAFDRVLIDGKPSTGWINGTNVWHATVGDRKLKFLEQKISVQYGKALVRDQLNNVYEFSFQTFQPMTKLEWKP